MWSSSYANIRLQRATAGPGAEFYALTIEDSKHLLSSRAVLSREFKKLTRTTRAEQIEVRAVGETGLKEVGNGR
jgi:hypothetical protein